MTIMNHTIQCQELKTALYRGQSNITSGSLLGVSWQQAVQAGLVVHRQRRSSGTLACSPAQAFGFSGHACFVTARNNQAQNQRHISSKLCQHTNTETDIYTPFLKHRNKFGYLQLGKIVYFLLLYPKRHFHQTIFTFFLLLNNSVFEQKYTAHSMYRMQLSLL